MADLRELACTELKLEGSQCEAREASSSAQNSSSLNIDCLVHSEWLSAALTGCCDRSLPPSISTEEIHWLLQPSCDLAPPPPWERVHISCLRKEASGTSNRHLVAQGTGYSVDSVHEFLAQVAQENYIASWRDTLGRIHGSHGSQTRQSRPSNSYIREVIEQLYNTKVITLGQGSDFKEERNGPVHANLIPILVALESRNAFYLITPYARFTLFDAALHSPAMFDDSVAKTLFVLYQLTKLLAHLHEKGISLGGVSLTSVFVDTRLWLQVKPSLANLIGRTDKPLPSIDHENNVTTPPTVTDSNTLWPESYTVPQLTISQGVTAWRSGALSNFDYLMLLNHHAGRVIGDPNNHPIFPWVVDFTSSDAGYRDLSRSKHFLTKGESQLEFTYISAQEEMRRAPDQDPLVPHHIGDISSDVTYYVYLARSTPREVLCSRVRPRWVPEEYPLSMEKMYIWSPDECIPEFYIDKTIFKSIHPDLPDLQLPRWAGTPDKFINYHRRMLEGDVVSTKLHHWIDLVFGYKLTGHDAVKAKNVYLSVVDKHQNPTNSGIVQLFKSSHPKKTVSPSAPFVLQEWSSYLHKSHISNVSTFPIQVSSCHTHLDTPTHHADEPKTLEAILSQESAKERAKPSEEQDTAGYLTQENQEEEFYGSFEHVNIPELSPSKNPSSNTDPGVRDFPLPDKVLTKPIRDSVGVPGTTRFKIPVVDKLIRPRRLQVEEESGYDWQSGEISLPKEAHLLDRLTRMEELSHFLSKSCKDQEDLFPLASEDSITGKPPESCPSTRVLSALEQLEGSPCNQPSFEERVGFDVLSVACTVIELACMRQLRAAIPLGAGLHQRVGTIRKLINSGQLKIPAFLLGLVDYVLAPDTPTSCHVTHLPSLSSSLLLQPFLPVVPFPLYFDPLYKFIHDLEQLFRETPLEATRLNTTEQLTCIVEFVSADIQHLMDVVSNEGLPLLLLHLYPIFTHPHTSFEAIFSFLDPLAQRMGCRNVERLFSLPLIHLFDTATLPSERAQLLSRTTAHMLITRFGLSVFLGRFIGFYLEAILEPLRVTASKPVKRTNKHIMRMPSQSVISDVLQSQAFDGRGRKTDLSFSLALSDGCHGFDSDKENSSSSDDSDSEDLVPESSILAKSSMYMPATPTEVEPLSASISVDSETNLPSPLVQTSPQTTNYEHNLHLNSEQDNLSFTTEEFSHGFHSDNSVSMDTGDSFDGFIVRTGSFGAASVREDPLPSDSDEEDTATEVDGAAPVSDPVTLAVNSQVAELAGDSLCWLSRRLGPLLATQHIVKPLLEGLHRCFSGVLGTADKQVTVLKCLSFFAELYGNDVILKLYIHRAENMVSAAMARMSVKNEGGLAASLALVRLAIKLLTHSMLQHIAKDLCENYFVPLIQLLSSETTFPSGGEARAAVCRSMVDLLLSLGERLGREEGVEILIATLQCFFACFDGVHSNEQETQLWGTPTDKSQRLKADDLFDLSSTPTNTSPVPDRKSSVEAHPLTRSTELASTPKEKMEASESYKQVSATFSQAMAHSAYIPFCRLLGQVQLNSKLYNTDLVEYITYKHDLEIPVAIPRALAELQDDDSDSSSPADSDTEEDPQHDAMLRVGPVSAVQGLGREQAKFDPPTWFVDLDTSVGKVPAVPVARASDSDLLIKPEKPAYKDALFDAKFLTPVQQTSPLETPLTQAALNKVALVASLAYSLPQSKTDHTDCQLKGVWSTLFEKQLHRSLHGREGFGYFKGIKLQTFSGHRGTVRQLAVSNGEHYFVSASRDKTAKVWKLSNHGDGEGTLPSSLTYTGHTKALFGVELLEGAGQVVSCDGAAHLWDLESGYCVQTFQQPNQFTTLRALSCQQAVLALTTSDLQLRFIDFRTQTLQHSWRLQFPTGGTARCLACAENWIAVGNSNGHINTLDIRTGELLSSWRPSDVYPNPATSWGDSLYQIRPTRRGNLVASIGQGLSLWRPGNRRLLHPIKGPAHTAQCMEIWGDQLITASNSGQLVLHEGFEVSDHSSGVSLKLRKGGMSTLGLLPENKLILVGTDIGPITLLA